MLGPCAHCQRPLLSVESDQHVTQGARVFCCAGCASARAVIERLGLGRFDALGGAPGPVARVDVDERGAAALASAAQAARARQGAGACRFAVDVDGVSCASCAWLVEKVAQKVDGVAGATLNPARGQLELVVGDDFAAADLARALADIGHRVTPSSPERERSGVVDELLFRFGVSAAAAMAAMIASFTLFFGLPPDSPYGRLFAGIAALASLIAVVVGGKPFLLGAWRSLRRGAPTMDVPIAVGMIGAEVSCLLAAREGLVVSFDTVSVFVTLMLLGRVLERRLVERHRHLLLASDDDVAGLEVRRIVDGVATFVPARDVQAGDRLQLARGELCPVDAVLEEPRALSFSWLTGESEPRTIEAGVEVPAGVHVVDGRGAVVVARRPFSSSRLATLLATTIDGDDRSAASGLFPWLARAWVIGVFIIAAVGAALWWHAGPVRVLDVVSALLVVTCPCAFGIAAPLGIERALVLLRGRGVFVKSSRLWWRASTVTKAVFDKTGTLTLEEPALDAASVAALSAWPSAAQQALLAVVARSNHGRSRALLRALQRLAVPQTAQVLDFHETAGVGMRARVRVGDDVVPVEVVRDEVVAAATRVAVGDRALAVTFVESPRPGVARELRRLLDLGIEVWIATGDDEEKARALASRLGIDEHRVRARCSPEDKAALVRALGGASQVLAVGDGVNDAPMFAEAAVCGVPALDRPHLPARADFLLLGTQAGGSFGSVVDVVVVARRVRHVLQGLLLTATFYNVLVVGAGLMGLLMPLLVAILMPLSSLSLLLAALLLVRLPGARHDDEGAALSTSPSAVLTTKEVTA